MKLLCFRLGPTLPLSFLYVTRFIILYLAASAFFIWNTLVLNYQPSRACFMLCLSHTPGHCFGWVFPLLLLPRGSGLLRWSSTLLPWLGMWVPCIGRRRFCSVFCLTIVWWSWTLSIFLVSWGFLHCPFHACSVRRGPVVICMWILPQSLLNVAVGFPILHVAEMWKQGDNKSIQVALAFYTF